MKTKITAFSITNWTTMLLNCFLLYVHCPPCILLGGIYRKNSAVHKYLDSGTIFCSFGSVLQHIGSAMKQTMWVAVFKKGCQFLHQSPDIGLHTLRLKVTSPSFFIVSFQIQCAGAQSQKSRNRSTVQILTDSTVWPQAGCFNYKNETCQRSLSFYCTESSHTSSTLSLSSWGSAAVPLSFCVWQVHTLSSESHYSPRVQKPKRLPAFLHTARSGDVPLAGGTNVRLEKEHFINTAEMQMSICLIFSHRHTLLRIATELICWPVFIFLLCLFFRFFNNRADACYCERGFPMP